MERLSIALLLATGVLLMLAMLKFRRLRMRYPRLDIHGVGRLAKAGEPDAKSYIRLAIAGFTCSFIAALLLMNWN